jgi:zinc protease
MRGKGGWFFAVAAIAATLLSGCAGRDSAGSVPLPPPSREVLPNGLRLIIQEHYASKTVALQLWVGVGGRDEAPSERGFSHFAEHMLFKGTDTLGPGFVDREVEGVGGRTNAGTSLDYTYYYMLLPSPRAARGIEVLADMAFNSRFDPDELAREREVVFEEVRVGEDNPRSFIGRRLYENAFTGYPYGYPVLGDPAALRAATRESLRGYYKQHYVPENMTLVVTGPVDANAIRGLVARAFGRVPTTGYARKALPGPPATPSPRRLTIERSERQAYLGLAWGAPALGDREMYAVEILAHILGGSRTSRLNQTLRERAKLVSTITAGYGALQGGGVVTVIAQLEPKDVEAAETAALGEIRRIREHGVTREEMERAVTAFEAERVFGRETVEGLALAYGRAETIWSLAGDREYLDRLRSVSAGDVKAAARRYLGDDYIRLALMPKRAAAQ